MLQPASYALGRWIAPGPEARHIYSPIDGAQSALAGGAQLETSAMLDWARDVGGPALRKTGFHDRARLVKSVAQYIDGRKEELYALNPLTGATRKDGAIDIDGGIGTMFVMASKARREMPDGQVYLDGPMDMLSRSGSFVGRHIAVPMTGVAVQINAFNFPVWGMLEKLAPALIAGMPVIVKPATQTCFLTEACFRMIVDSGILPDGAVQLIVGGIGDMLNQLGPQDVVSFTGSAATANALRQTPGLIRNSVRFHSEQDSLNATILGDDVTPGSTLFARFVSEVVSEMTIKAGQKCTAIRRIIVPDHVLDPVSQALSARLAAVRLGDPSQADTQMGPVASAAQQQDVLDCVARLQAEAALVFGGPDALDMPDHPNGAFVAPTLLACADADAATLVHSVEAFGPVATLVPARDREHGASLANRGGGSLVTSLFTDETAVARDTVAHISPWNGRVYINSSESLAESTGHGAPLPHMIHGGPGRAGGGEELGGLRGILHYMHRSAVQGSPDMLSAISGEWVRGASRSTGPAHPFQRTFDEIVIGESIHTSARTISLDDVEHFAHFTGDTFYAHMDEDAASANPFFPGRVAHGYLLLSFAAGLFVHPDPGPVLANTGLNNLRFQKPVEPGHAVSACLTVMRKTRRTATYGEIAWHVELINQDAETVAEYDLLTMVSYAR